jgi:hypothetical protein
MNSKNSNLCVWQHSHYDDRAMGWITDELWFYFRGTRITLLQCADWLWDPTSCLFQWVLLALSLIVKWPGSEVGHSPPSRAEIKNKWMYSSIHTYAFMSCTGTNLPFYLNTMSVCLSIFDLKCLSDFHEIFQFSAKIVKQEWLVWKSPQWPSHFTWAVIEFLVILSIFCSQFLLNSV